MPEFQGKAALHLSISGGAVCMAIPQVQKSGAAGPRQKRGTWASPAVREGPGGLRINWLPAPSCGVVCGQF